MKIFSFVKFLIIMGLLFIFFPLAAFPGDWSVTPIRLDLGRDAKSGVINVSNDAPEKLSVQMTAKEWSQDAAGKDQYTDTADLIFFPKIMVIDKKESRVIRVGIKSLAAAREKTYRLFVEEIPEPKNAEGASVAIAVKFGVPIFVKPLEKVEKGEIGTIALIGGVLSTEVKNTGTVHFRINSVNIKGKNSKGEETIKTELKGWYLLSGASRTYTTTFPKDVCAKTAKAEIEVKTENFSLNGKLDVDKAMCSP
jgi:fimbrial chaperone protein